MMSSIKDELDELGRKITEDAKKYALPNKKTGALDKSFKYETNFISNEKFQIVINEKYYGVYLNNKTHYMDRALKENLPKGTESIINAITGEILQSVKEINKK